ncbi:hypothetical protein, partial [Rahnella bonaserana]|uniref:hypothetical protein n=1 Tax=Rahnella bonaserana TaxID=2816248 RepID=UPI003208D7F5
GGWKETGAGTGVYTATYTANTASTGNAASLKLGGWGAAKTSAKYDITAAVPDQANSKIERDRATYAAGDDVVITVTLKD